VTAAACVHFDLESPEHMHEMSTEEQNGE
jgi:hypothetical protein